MESIEQQIVRQKLTIIKELVTKDKICISIHEYGNFI